MTKAKRPDTRYDAEAPVQLLGDGQGAVEYAPAAHGERDREADEAHAATKRAMNRLEHLKKLATLLFVGAVLLALWPSAANASCAAVTATQARNLETTLLVFRGTVVKIDEFRGTVKRPFLVGGKKVDEIDTELVLPAEVLTFNVDRVWKGWLGRSITLSRLKDPYIIFTLGQQYAVFVSRPNDLELMKGMGVPHSFLTVMSCASGQVNAGDRKRFEDLGPGRAPE